MRIVLSFDELARWINNGMHLHRGTIYSNDEQIPWTEFEEAQVPYQRPIVEVDDRYLTLSEELDVFPLPWVHVRQVGTWNQEGLRECWARLRGFSLVPEETWSSGLFKSCEEVVETPSKGEVPKTFAEKPEQVTIRSKLDATDYLKVTKLRPRWYADMHRNRVSWRHLNMTFRTWKYLKRSSCTRPSPKKPREPQEVEQKLLPADQGVLLEEAVKEKAPPVVPRSVQTAMDLPEDTRPKSKPKGLQLRRVSKDGTIRFENRMWKVEEVQAHTEVAVKRLAGKLVVYHGDQRVTAHPADTEHA